MGRSAIGFEQDVFESLHMAAKGTDFDKTIHLLSGHKFPDITVKSYYGVEVKTTKQNHWKSTGNSVLESTRVENVGRIYIFFAKLVHPISFRFRLYQECLYDIAVTHSPRYLIDMNLGLGKSFFDKIGMSYDVLRNSENPIKPIMAYYRSIAKQGEEPWWMDNHEENEIVTKATVTLWSNLTREEQNRLRIEAMARFPEILGSSTSKYQNFASWLAARYGIVDSSLRDRFSAGGRVDLNLGDDVYHSLPRVFQHLESNAEEIIQTVKKIAPEDARHHWNLSTEPTSPEQLLTEWINLVLLHSQQLLPNSEKFIVHLLSRAFSKINRPPVLKKLQARYGLRDLRC